MKLRNGLLLLLLTATSITFYAQQPTAEIGGGEIEANQYHSRFFKFHYSFPQGWNHLDLEAQAAGNDAAYRKAEEKSLKQNGPDRKVVEGNRTTTTTTTVSTPVDLLIASPTTIAKADESPLPRVRIWATKRLGAILNGAEDNAKVLSIFAKKVVYPAKEVTLGGRKMVRVDLLTKQDTYRSNIMTVSGDYLIGFDFYAKSPEELESLVKTMDGVRFD